MSVETTSKQAPSTQQEYKQPQNGAFTIVTCSDHVLLFKKRDKDIWELPGGGEEAEDNGSLEKTAVREAMEEVKVKIRPARIIKVGNFIQRFKGRTEEGTVELFQAQTFHLPDSHIGKDYFIYNGQRPYQPEAETSAFVDKIFEGTEEAERICFINLPKIFDDSIKVSLAHKRMILHWLNWREEVAKVGSCVIHGRLADTVTAVGLQITV
ncbi:MAG: hypothetical protein QG563_427 [Patescibacteria group bacterium]|nr:hypothetical protein [Patescibacteria group bacterium]